jgi:hypothetical protein
MACTNSCDGRPGVGDMPSLSALQCPRGEVTYRMQLAARDPEPSHMGLQEPYNNVSLVRKNRFPINRAMPTLAITRQCNSHLLSV